MQQNSLAHLSLTSLIFYLKKYCLFCILNTISEFLGSRPFQNGIYILSVASKRLVSYLGSKYFMTSMLIKNRFSFPSVLYEFLRNRTNFYRGSYKRANLCNIYERHNVSKIIKISCFLVTVSVPDLSVYISHTIYNRKLYFYRIYIMWYSRILLKRQWCNVM